MFSTWECGLMASWKLEIKLFGTESALELPDVRKWRIRMLWKGLGLYYTPTKFQTKHSTLR